MKTASPNPFSTKFTRPGSLPPLDADGHPIAVDALLSRFAELGGIGAIVGPHGSGKSTLLSALARRLASASRLGRSLRLGGGWRRDVRDVVAALARCGHGSVVAIDGWERLGPLTSAATHLAARLLGRGLLVTAHRRGTVAVLAECRTSPALLAGIVRRLRPQGDAADEAEATAAFEAAGGDVREALFILYDRFEELRARADAAPIGSRGGVVPMPGDAGPKRPSVGS